MNFIKYLRYGFEFAVLLILLTALGFMSVKNASDNGGKLGRNIGRRLTMMNRRALKHLKVALPGRKDEDYKKIVEGMWDNLGRIIAEYPELENLSPDTDLEGIENLRNALEKYGKVILFSGHIGNWEIMAPCLADYGLKLDLVYRPLNNPFAERLMTHYRSLRGKLRTLPKSSQGTRQLVGALRDGRSVGILIDQKYNEGLKVPFFGQPAMTSDAFVRLAQKYDAGLVPFRVERLNGIHFRLTFFDPLQTMDKEGAPRPVEDVIAEAHKMLEQWITERPEQWLWLHRRWIGDAGKDDEAIVKKPLAQAIEQQEPAA